MTSLLTRRVARVLGSAAALWIVPASAADLAIRACPDIAQMRPTAVKKVATTGRSSFHRPVVHHEPAPAVRTVDSDRSDVWYRRQFVMLVGIAY